MLSLEIWILIATVVGFVPLYIDLIWRMKERDKIDFKLLRFRKIYQALDDPKHTEDRWNIRILHPNKPIEHCSVWYNNERLGWDKKEEPYYETFIDTMSGGNIKLPIGIDVGNANISIKNGKRTIKKTKLLDIPVVPE
jgi:hypothetical protein